MKESENYPYCAKNPSMLKAMEKRRVFSSGERVVGGAADEALAALEADEDWSVAVSQVVARAPKFSR